MLFLAVYDLPVVIFVKQNKKFETVFVIFIAIFNGIYVSKA